MPEQSVVERSIFNTEPELTQATIQKVLLTNPRDFCDPIFSEVSSLYLPLLPPEFSLSHLELKRRTRTTLTAAGFFARPGRLRCQRLADLMTVPGFGVTCLLDLLVKLNPYMTDVEVEQDAFKGSRHGIARRQVFRRAVVREAGKLAETKGAGGVLADDPRLGNLVRALDPTCESLDAALDRLRTKAYAPHNPVAALTRLRQLQQLMEEFSQLTLEDELFGLIAVPSREENVRRAVQKHLGWDGGSGETKRAVSAEFGTAREYVSEMIEHVESSLGEARAAYTPMLDRALVTCLRIPPTELSDKSVGQALKEDGIVRGSFTVDGLKRACEIIRPRAATQWLEHIAAKQEQRSELKKLESVMLDTARRVARRYGVARYEDLASEIQKTLRDKITDFVVQSSVLDGEEVKRISLGIRQIEMIDNTDGWFVVDSPGRDRLMESIKKVLVIAGDIGIEDLHAALDRYTVRAGPMPPPPVLLALCRQFGWCIVKGDTIRAEAIDDAAAEVLTPSERTVIEVLKMRGELTGAELLAECRLRGVAMGTFYKTVTHSPIVKRCRRSSFQLCGTPC